MTPFTIRRRSTPAGPRWTLYQRRQGRDLIAILFPLERISEHRTHAQAVTRMDFELRWLRARGWAGPLPRPWPLLGVDALQQSTYTLAAPSA